MNFRFIIGKLTVTSNPQKSPAHTAIAGVCCGDGSGTGGTGSAAIMS